MLSYRHYFHAGNFADVIKHTIYCLLLRRLQRKDSPLFVLDTHAGAGKYDLSNPMAAKCKEYEQGVTLLLARANPPALVQDYLDLIRAMNPTPGVLRYYPGSPRLARGLLRPQDHLALCELHTSDIALLKSEFQGDASVSIHSTSGYQALEALLPPIQRRGVVFIDPAFELKDEYDRLAQAFEGAHARWPTGVYAIWFPLQNHPSEQHLLPSLAGMNIRKLLLVEVCVRDDSRGQQLNGCGMVIANPPWQFETDLNVLIPWLWETLSPAKQGKWLIEWLVPE